MDDQEIENKIAEAMGWHEVSSWKDSLEMGKTEWCGWEPQQDNSIVWGFIPKYCSDLNAVRKAELKLLKNDTDRSLYAHRLSKAMGTNEVFADARQRAITLLQLVSEK